MAAGSAVAAAAGVTVAEEKILNTEGWFSANFELVFLLSLSMNIAPIYRAGRG